MTDSEVPQGNTGPLHTTVIGDKAPEHQVDTQREIKFKAWEGDSWFKGTGWLVLEVAAKRGLVAYQFTSLYDTDGQEIYDGDIIRLKNGTEWIVGFNVSKAAWTCWSDSPSNCFVLTEPFLRRNTPAVVGHASGNDLARKDSDDK